MVHFSLTDEQLAFKQSIIEFAARELNENLAEKDDNAEFPWINWKKCASMDLLFLLCPEEYGGLNLGLPAAVASIEGLSYGCRDSGLVHSIVTQLCCIIQISLFGTDDQKAAYLPALGKGDKIAAQAITEPGAGSDVFSMGTRAVKEDGHYILNGSKTFISNGPLADLITVFAVTNPERKKIGGISSFIIEKGLHGFSAGKPLKKMGLRTLQNGELFFDNCRIPAKTLLGKDGQGMILFNEVIEWERALLSAAHIGTMERILESCIKYAKGRIQFGKPIGNFQSISHKIAEMKVGIELGRLMLYKAALMKALNKRATIETSIAKLFISENLKKTCLEAIQIHGGYGYMKEFEIERDLRDSVASTIYSGSSELQRNIIASIAGL